MPDWNDISERFAKLLTELDAEPIQAEAEKPFRLALVGAPGSGKTTLACAFAERVPSERSSYELAEFLPEFKLPLSTEDVAGLDSASLIILILDATKGDYAAEVAAADYLSYLGKPMLVCYSKMDLLPSEARLIRGEARWRGTEIMPLKAVHPETVREMLCPAILDIMPDVALAIARRLPAFRSLYADRLTEHTALVNATYASASGLAESVPLLRMPLYADDIVDISANLAVMGYSLGLAFGLHPLWYRESTVAPLALQVGQCWQQFARQLVGLIPLWGLESKVGLVYGGTLVTGKALQAWCDSGHLLLPQALRAVCRATVPQARHTSHNLVAKARDALPVPQVKRARTTSSKLRFSTLAKRRKKPVCSACGRSSSSDAVFCAYCGARLSEPGLPIQNGNATGESNTTATLAMGTSVAHSSRPDAPVSEAQPTLPQHESTTKSSSAE